MDVVLKLRELRRLRGLSQKDAAQLSGVGEKTISSFETGERIESLKIWQLRSLLRVYGLSEVEFFSYSLDQKLDPEGKNTVITTGRLLEELSALPRSIRGSLLEKFHLMIETASEIHQMEHASKPSYARNEVSDWQMLTSRN